MTYSMSDQIKVREISPFFIVWIFINKNCFMKQIFEILQEERDRILSIHESATKNHYLGEQTVGPFNTANPQLNFAVKNILNQPKPKVGNETSTPNKLQHKLGSIRYLYNDNKQINYVLPKDKTIFKFNPDKNGATFRGYDYDPTTKKAGNVVYNGWFNCSSGKFHVKSASGTFKYYSDKAFVDFLKAKCEKVKTEKGSLKKDNLGQSGTGSESTSTAVVKPTEAALDLIIQKIPAGSQTATQPTAAATQPTAATQQPTAATQTTATK